MIGCKDDDLVVGMCMHMELVPMPAPTPTPQIGRASCRERV